MGKSQYSNPKKDFPIFLRQANKKALIYLDSAATSQKPQQVINAITDFYANHNANIHSGVFALAEEATQMYESVRLKAARFIGAKNPAEIIFTRGATEGINLASYSWGEQNVRRGDNIVATIMEHHSNFVPWQELCKRKKAHFRAAPLTQDGKVDLPRLYNLINEKTKLLAIAHASNVLGTINPIGRVVRRLRVSGHKLRVFVDGAQAVPHVPVNVRKLGCDFYAFSGHKMLGPTGVGVLWAKQEILERMPPFLFGGHMISRVTSGNSEWGATPVKFEAGTPPVAAVVGLGAAIDYLQNFGMENVRRHDREITKYALSALNKIKGIAIYGSQNATDRVGVISFNVKGLHPHDLATALDEEGIAVRAGHQCAMPLHREALGVAASVRISPYIYNTRQEIDALVAALLKIQKKFLAI